MTTQDTDPVTAAVTIVTSVFTENLLRSITSLTAEQQLSLVKDLGGLGKTQVEIAKAMRWSRGQVSNHVSLKAICPEAWQPIVATTEAGFVASDAEPVVATIATTVAFTEGLLRSITCLTAEQQLWLVTSLAAGKVDKASSRKTAAEKAKARNGWRAEAARQLKDLPDEYLERAYDRIDKGAFDPQQRHPIPPRRPKSRDPQTAITFVRERVMIEG